MDESYKQNFQEGPGLGVEVIEYKEGGGSRQVGGSLLCGFESMEDRPSTGLQALQLVPVSTLNS